MKRSIKMIISGAFLLVLFSNVSLAQSSQSTNPQTADCAEVAVISKRLENAQNRLSDWPQLNGYRADNAKLAAPGKDEQRVVFMGDSITDWWVRPENGGFFPGKPYVDRGISGQTTPQMLVRFRPDVIALKPKVVVILAGTNDIAGNTGPMPLSAIEDNMISMLELARAEGIKIVFASVLPVSDYGHDREGKQIFQTKTRPPAEILQLNAWMKQYASENG